MLVVFLSDFLYIKRSILAYNGVFYRVYLENDVWAGLWKSLLRSLLPSLLVPFKPEVFSVSLRETSRNWETGTVPVTSLCQSEVKSAVAVFDKLEKLEFTLLARQVFSSCDLQQWSYLIKFHRKSARVHMTKTSHFSPQYQKRTQNASSCYLRGKNNFPAVNSGTNWLKRFRISRPP